MNLFENIKNAWDILTRNKVRSFLTMLGIIIGVMSVIIILAVGAGAQSLILTQVKSLGSNLVGILPGKSDDKGPPVSVFGVVITTLTYEDGKALLTGDYPAIKAVAAYVRGSDVLTFQENKFNSTFVGTSYGYPQVEDIKLAEGRFFTEEEERALSRVVVLGSDVAKNLFPDSDPVGQQLKIKRYNFTVIGVVKSRGVSGFQNQDTQVFIPITTAQKMLLGINYVSFIRVKIDEAEHVDPAMEYISSLLRERHNIDNSENDDFSVRSTNQGLEVLTNITNALKFFLAAIAAIALLVGGIGIMNVMLAAVQERTREIGLRKAVGAKRGQIVGQFLIETIFITYIGGTVGIVLGILISIVVALVARSMGYSWDLVISPFSIVFGWMVSVSIGLIFGLAPARRASRLSPIDALRYE
jgi:ABC-type antimicrobial peptide transport system permease subunit